MVFTIYGHVGHLEFQIITHFSLILYNHHIKAKYEISLQLAQYFHRKCHLKFFMNRCMATKVAMEFSLNFISVYVIRTLSLIFLWNIVFCVIFPNFTPPTQGSFMIKTERFLLFYIARCPICFLQNISPIRLVVLEKKSFNGFYHIWAILNFKSWPILA